MRKHLFIFLNLLNPTSILCCCFFIILYTFEDRHMHGKMTDMKRHKLCKWQSKSYPAGTHEGIGDFGERSRAVALLNTQSLCWTRLRNRLVKRSDAKRKRMSWQQREQIAQGVEWDIVRLWSRRRNSYKHM